MTTRAFRTLDCAQKVRVHYYLPCAIDPVFLAGLNATKLEIQEFSKQVQGAKDHFRLECGKMWAATGVLGARKLIVTYGKFGNRDEHVEGNISAVHAALESLGCGPVQAQAGKSEKRSA